MNKLIKKYAERLKKPQILIFIGLAGILLIFLSSFWGTDQENESKKTAEFSAEDYKAELEADITDMVKDITGSRDISVVITLESGIRYTYADTKEEISSDKTQESAVSSDFEIKEGYITVKTADGGEQALLVTTMMPEIRGVAIVCEGGDIESINEKIKNAVTSALNITSKRVYICGRKTR